MPTNVCGPAARSMRVAPRAPRARTGRTTPRVRPRQSGGRDSRTITRSRSPAASRATCGIGCTVSKTRTKSVAADVLVVDDDVVDEHVVAGPVGARDPDLD